MDVLENQITAMAVVYTSLLYGVLGASQTYPDEVYSTSRAALNGLRHLHGLYTPNGASDVLLPTARVEEGMAGFMVGGDSSDDEGDDQN